MKVAEAQTERPVPCLWLMVFDPSGTKRLGRYDRRSDSMGVARIGFPGPGKWVIRCKRSGYRDTSAVLVIEESPTDTLRVAMRATGGWVAPCNWGSWEGTVYPEPKYGPELLRTVADTLAATPRDIDGIVKPVMRNPKPHK